MSRLTLERAALLGVLSLGLAARLSQYVYNRSLWLDEAYLTLNILRRDWAGLLRPLDNDQVAPPAFLYVVKLAVSFLGESEYALRLFPLLAGIATLFLFYHLARTHLGRQSALIAAALLGWSQPVIYFCSEVKPYASDTLFALVAYALCLPLLNRRAPLTWRRVLFVGWAGALLVWFSYPVVFVLAAAGAACVLGPLLRRAWRALPGLLAISLMWAASLAALYVVALEAGLSNEFLRTFWGDFFASFPPRSLSDVYWYAQLLFNFLVQAAGLPFYGLALFAWLAGGVALWKRGQWQMAVALGLPLGLAMAAAALRQYPFYGRTLLFAVPPTLLLIAEGTRALYASLVKDSRITAGLLIAVLLFHPLYRTVIVFPQPLTGEESRPVLQYVRDQSQPGDQLYVYHGAAPACAYYAPRLGLDNASLYVGRASNGDFASLTQDIQAMQGARVWFLFTHVYSFGGISEDAFILDQLNRDWPRLETFSAPGAAVYLYDMR